MSTYTSSLGLEEITPGDQAGLWGNTTNNNLALIDQAVTGVTPISFTGLSGTVYTLTTFDGAVDEARASVLNITGIATGSNTVVVPNKQKTYLVRNATGQDVIFRTASPTATYTVGAGNSILIFCDGNNNVFTGIASPSVGTLGVAGGGTGATTFTAGFVKSTGGTNALTTSSSVSLTADVSGTLPVTNGGTGQTSFTSGGLLRGNGSSAIATLVGSANGQVATWNGSEWTAATPAAGAVTSIIAGTGISVSSPTGAVTITNTNTTNTVNPTFSTSVTTPIYYVGNTSNYITQSSNEIAFIAGGVQTAKITNAGIGANALVCAAGSSGDQRVNVTGVGLNTGLSPAGIQLGASSWGIIYNSGVPRIEAIGGGSVFWFSQSAQNYQSNNSPNWSTLSDVNIKTNVRPINNALAKLVSLKPSHFEYKNEIGKTRSGFIAQEFETVFPGHTTEIVAGEEYQEFLPEGQNTLKTLDLNMVPYLVKAIQELKAELDEAKAEIAALKAQ